MKTPSPGNRRLLAGPRGLLIRLLSLAGGLGAGFLLVSALGPGLRKGPADLPERARDWDPSLGSPPRFVDVTQEAGISFRHENGMTGKYSYPEVMGAGVGLLDYDSDGDLDIYFVNGNRLTGNPDPQQTNRLYRNEGRWSFTDATAQAGVGHSGYGQGCCVGDYDNDGDPDLYVSNFGPNVLYRNRGDGTFADVSAAAGVADPGWGQTCSFLDFDGDGWLDLYAQNYLTYSMDFNVEAYIYLGRRKVLDYATPMDFQGSASRLFRNRGDGTFRDVTVESGLHRPDGKGMGCACADFDDDGFTDIFVANDGMENFYFHNLGNGKFEEIGLAAGLAYDGEGMVEASMGVDVGDFDRDGRMDIICPCLRLQGFTLYRNLGKFFADASSDAGLDRLTSTVTGFSPNFLDYDSDGDLDLFFTTGGVRSNELVPEDAPYSQRYGYRDLLLAGDGKGRFADASGRAGPHFQEVTVGRGSAAGDLDNDGDLDLAISNLGDRAAVLRNDTPSGHWIALRLVPRAGNRDALGASVWIEAGGAQQRAAVHGGVSYLSQNDRRIHFGLGGAARVDRLEILWPNRERQVLENLPADRFLTIEQGAGRPRETRQTIR